MHTTPRSEQPRTGRADTAPGRVRRVGSWVVWHWLELTGVLLPALLALLVSWWLLVLSGAVLVLWTVHEARSVRPVRNGSNPGIGGGRDTPARAAIEPGTGDRPSIDRAR